MGKPSVKLVAASYTPDGAFPVKSCQHKSTSDHDRASYFKSAQWSADGTCLFTLSSANRICSYLLPSDLLEPHPQPVSLVPQGTLVLGDATNCFTPSPYFTLEHPSTHTILTASNDHPIHLHHAFPQPPDSAGSSSYPFPYDESPVATQPPPLASYRLIKHETEAYLPLTSLIWPSPGSHFICGTTNRIALFDATHPTPILEIPTIPSTRHIMKGGGVGMRGTVSALSQQPQSQDSTSTGVVAAGTWTRNLGLYDLHRAGSCVATWSLTQHTDTTVPGNNTSTTTAADGDGIGGKGVVQTAWSPCGRYLVVNERGSHGLLVYDLRGTNRLLATLTGRDADTNQRLSVDVFPGAESVGGFEVWAGTKHGGVVVYEGVGNTEGVVGPSWGWDTNEKRSGSAVGSTVMHLSGSVVATVSGSWKIADSSDDDTDSSDEGTDDDSDSETNGSEEEENTSDQEDDSEGEGGSDEDDSSSHSDSGPEMTTSKSERHERPNNGGYQSKVVMEGTSLRVWSIGSSNTAPIENDEREPDNEWHGELLTGL
ncbi:hypothetical protein QBC46DRAFT_441184 [Diplogelasinospora grovesii]|uniref:WD40 repeat-like protein n=1 Tax=Diplogelasinospora grovesii TaxID=303347 RepID=A0AAN6N424_9PEZI|nr:hypothetical protein QBC46DRAFT_441184 [Diplogelasinospora grovesii]